MQQRVVFPFSAIVGMDKLKLAILINAINPKVGGLLIRGPKGSGKTTAVRGLSEILPNIKVVKDCPFKCNPSDPSNMCSKCTERQGRGEQLPVEERKMAVVNLPLGATEDRVIGSLDVEKVIKQGIEALEPGILADANQNILYVDEINLLPDHISDDLLDAAATGWNVVEREGISVSHPSRFVFIGTMNPEEGELRPQLLDRFPLSVGVDKVASAAERIEIVKRNIDFEKNPAALHEKYKAVQEELKKRIGQAQETLPKVKISEKLLILISKVCLDLKVDGVRPDIVIAKAAATLAAYENRKNVILKDVVLATELALGHRTREGGFLEPATPDDIRQAIEKKAQETQYSDEDFSKESPPSGTEEREDETDVVDEPEPRIRDKPSFKSDKDSKTSYKDQSFKGTMEKKQSIFSSAIGKLVYALRGKSKDEQEKIDSPKGGEAGGEGGAERIFDDIGEVGDAIPSVSAALTALDVTSGALILEKIERSTLPATSLSFKIKKKTRGIKSSSAGKRAEAVSTLHRGRAYGWRFPKGKPRDIHFPATIRVAARRQKFREKPAAAALKICMEDVREKSRLYRAPMTIVFVIDLSGSMRFSVTEAKQAILKLHGDAYRGRDKVGIVGFKGTGAVVVQHPISNLRVVANKLSTLRVSGFTPLAAGMLKACEVLKACKKRDMSTIPVMAVITDGCANVPLNRSLDTDEVRLFNEMGVDNGAYDYLATKDVLDVCKIIKKEGIYTISVNTNQYLTGRNTYGYWVTRQIALRTNGAHHELGRFEGKLLASKMFSSMNEDRRMIGLDASTNRNLHG